MKLIGVSILLLQGNANFSIRSKKEIYPRKEVPRTTFTTISNSTYKAKSQVDLADLTPKSM
ncbi:MAG: hypothetical protein WBP88_13730 [Nitrososphaeraceae archaeon]